MSSATLPQWGNRNKRYRTEDFRLRLSPAEKALMERAARETRMSVSEVIRMAVKMYLDYLDVQPSNGRERDND